MRFVLSAKLYWRVRSQVYAAERGTDAAPCYRMMKGNELMPGQTWSMEKPRQPPLRPAPPPERGSQMEGQLGGSALVCAHTDRHR